MPCFFVRDLSSVSFALVAWLWGLTERTLAGRWLNKLQRRTWPEQRRHLWKLRREPGWKCPLRRSILNCTMQPHHGRSENMLRAHSHGMTAVALFVGPDTVSASTSCRSFLSAASMRARLARSRLSLTPRISAYVPWQRNQRSRVGTHSLLGIAPQRSNISATAMQ